MVATLEARREFFDNSQRFLDRIKTQEELSDQEQQSLKLIEMVLAMIADKYQPTEEEQIIITALLNEVEKVTTNEGNNARNN